MGGCFTVVAQARHRIYDAIAVLGYSAIAGTLPAPPEGAKVDPMRYVMHSDDANADLVDADVGHGYPVRATMPPWASATMPSVARTLLRPGLLSVFSRDVDVPVFLGCGERDMVPTPRAEPSYYPASSDITLTVIPRMAHMHNFARTREMLWSRLHTWGESIASLRSRLSAGFRRAAQPPSLVIRIAIAGCAAGSGFASRPRFAQPRRGTAGRGRRSGRRK